MKRVPAAELENLLLREIGSMLAKPEVSAGEMPQAAELDVHGKQGRAFLFRALSLVKLAPDIIEAILNGKEPSSLTLSKLRKGFPEDWIEQQKLFGME